MEALYLDNYRGFSNQIIPLQKVNFFVGENSSGKTSILAALKLITSLDTYFRNVFSIPDLPFHSFAEFISKGSARKNFVIGFKSDKKSNDFVLMKFEDGSGVPVVKGYISGSGDMVVYVDMKGRLEAGVFKKRFKSFEEAIAFGSEKFELLPTDCGADWSKKIDFPTRARKHFGAALVQQIALSNYYEERGEDGDKLLYSIGSPKPCRWIAPIRAKPRRIYTDHVSEYSPEGVHAPYVIRKLYDSKLKRDVKLVDSIEKFGNYSGLFDSVSIRRYGRGVDDPFGINIERNKVTVGINNVGYGVSQVLPILLELGQSGRKEGYTAIQQPEVHLHPRAQAALGQFLHDVSREGARLLVETHSDFVIDRFRLSQNKSDAPVSAQVVFVSRGAEGCRVVTMEIDEKGHYPEDQPDEFRDFFFSEELALIRM